ncbi:MAG: hypothetical protein LBS46_08730, partial [Dysgonamonadaceae bacterium]|nr:hypothetical protein [Dysgonamonadaceae bacterium]
GKKYKLTLKFREPKFAASNIYWDNTAQKLTFAPYSETPSLVPENQYQGIFFKFGSLIGMSPKDNGNSSTTPLFVPPTRSGGYGTWYITSADGSLTTAGLPSELADSPVYNHINENGTLWTGTNYDAIPYAIGGVVRTTPDESYSDRYVIDMPADSLAEFKGDICKYINPLYRLPMAYEFGSFGTAQWDPNPNIGWTKVGTPWDLVTSDQADGTYINTNNTGAKYGWTENFFPASGYRSAVWEVHEAGSSGRYWSGSIEGSGEPNRTNVYCLYFTSIQMNATSSVGRKNGFPVRCILQE